MENMKDVEIEPDTILNEKKREGRIQMPSLNIKIGAAFIFTIVLFLFFQFSIQKNKILNTNANISSAIQEVKEEWLNKEMSINSTALFLVETVYNITKQNHQMQLLFYPDNYQMVKNYMFIFHDPHMQNYTIGHFTNVYTNKDGIVVNEEGVFTGRKRSTSAGKVVSKHEKVIALGYSYCDYYVDFLGPLLLMNSSILDSSVIIIDKMFPIDIIKCFDISSQKLVTLEKNQYVYCSDLYTIYRPDTKHAYYWTLPLLRHKFVSAYNLANIIPVNNVIINSMPMTSQYITNWEPLLRDLNSTLPQKKWHVEIHNSTTIETTAKRWASYLIVITLDNSVISNCIFMNTDSTLVELHSLQISNVHMMYTQALGLEHICVRCFRSRPPLGVRVFIDNVLNGVLSSKNAYI